LLLALVVGSEQLAGQIFGQNLKLRHRYQLNADFSEWVFTLNLTIFEPLSKTPAPFITQDDFFIAS
jgi:hypothetical protein